MTANNAYTVFEYGYLTSERDQNRLPEAQALPEADFRWLEQRCLKDEGSDDQRLLALRSVRSVKVIQVKNYVGVIALPQRRFIEVLPKTGRQQEGEHLARNRLLMMLRTLKTFRHITTASASVATSRMTLMDIFIQQFLSCLELVVRKGLKHDYLRQQDNLPWLKGKLLVSEQLKKNSVRRDRFCVEYDEYRVERPENRLLKSAIDKVYGYTSNPQLLQQLSRLRALFEDIPPIDHVETAFQQIHLDRHMQHYQHPLAWARLILTGSAPHCMQGNADAISLLFPMEAVFEAFVTAWMHQRYSALWQIRTQSRAHYLVQQGDAALFQLRPDIWLLPQKESVAPPIICDVKWKLVNGQQRNCNLAQSDLYQMLAYGVNHLQGEGDMLLIYPQHPGFTTPPEHPFEYQHSHGRRLRLWALPFAIGDSVAASRLIVPEGLPLLGADS